MNSVMNPPIIQSSQWSKVRAIISSDASNLCTNSGVHTIGLSSLHLPWLSANFPIHSYSIVGKNVKKISWIFVYRYQSNHSSFDSCGFLFSCVANSWILLSNQPLIYFLFGFQWYNIRHLYEDFGPGNGTIYWHVGAWPRFGVNYPMKTLYY